MQPQSTTMNVHPATSLFPMMGEAELQELAHDIREHGLQVPITMYQGQILDGRNRWRACEMASVVPITEEWHSDGDPTAWVISLNFVRRHLTESQKAIVLVKADALLPYKAQARERQIALAGTRRDSDLSQLVDEGAGRAAERAGERFGVNRQYFYDAEKLLAEAPDLAAQVEADDLSIPKAMREMRDRQPKPPIPQTPNKYRVIYADPPWQYSDSLEGEAMQKYGPAERHYPTMSIEGLCALPVASLAEPNAVLFLWVTSPLLEECFPIIRAWGFRYKACFVWDKVRHNWGHYNSVRHELLLICTRGSCLPDSKELHDSVVSLERTAEHSQKPAYFRELIDRMYPSGKRIELFQRGTAALGWEVWGYGAG